MVGGSEDDVAIAARIAAGDEPTFNVLLEAHHASMVRVARGWVGSTAVAEEVAQETWMDVIAGIDGYEGRASLKSWIFRILARKAVARKEREARTVSVDPIDEQQAPVLDPSRFQPGDHRWAGHWAIAPAPLPDERLFQAETRRAIDVAIERLSEAQRRVITLRDVEGFDAHEVCELLGVSEANQRVLLHRARTSVRLALARHLGAEP